MKALQILLIILLCTTPLYAEQALVLTEIEGIQEKIWHLQRNMAAQKAALEKDQKQLGLLAAKVDADQRELSEKLTALTQTNIHQQEEVAQRENDLQLLRESLSTLSVEVSQQNSTILEQAGKIGTLEGSLQALRAEFASQQLSTEKALAETNQKLDETRSKLDALGQDVGVRVEQIALWGGGAALLLAVILTLAFALRRNPAKKVSPEQKQPPRHEM